MATISGYTVAGFGGWDPTPAYAALARNPYIRARRIRAAVSGPRRAILIARLAGQLLGPVVASARAYVRLWQMRNRVTRVSVRRRPIRRRLAAPFFSCSGHCAVATPADSGQRPRIPRGGQHQGRLPFVRTPYVRLIDQALRPGGIGNLIAQPKELEAGSVDDTGSPRARVARGEGKLRAILGDRQWQRRLYRLPGLRSHRAPRAIILQAASAITDGSGRQGRHRRGRAYSPPPAMATKKDAKNGALITMSIRALQVRENGDAAPIALMGIVGET